MLWPEQHIHVWYKNMYDKNQYKSYCWVGMEQNPDSEAGNPSEKYKKSINSWQKCLNLSLFSVKICLANAPSVDFRQKSFNSVKFISQVKKRRRNFQCDLGSFGA